MGKSVIVANGVFEPCEYTLMWLPPMFPTYRLSLLSTVTPNGPGGRADFRGNTQSGVVRYTHYLMQLSLAQVRSFDNR